MREPETHRRAADSTPRGRDAVRMPLKIVLTLESLWGPRASGSGSCG